MDTGTHALVLGLVAGLGVALPLGAIGVLLLQEGIERGWRSAAAGATGVALVDLGYACLASLAGTAVSRALSGWTRPLQIGGAVVLVAVAARGLLALRAKPSGFLDHGGSGVGVGREVGRFVVLTAVNPLTAVYFVVLTAGLGSAVAGPVAGVAFVSGVFLASWAWQLTLASAGSLAGARLPERVRLATVVLGNLVVVGYAVSLALP